MSFNTADTGNHQPEREETHIHLVAVASFVGHIDGLVSQKGGAIRFEFLGALCVRRVLGETVKGERERAHILRLRERESQ